MARAPTTEDVFNAIAEPKRRRIVELLACQGGTAMAVGAIVASLGWAQPAVSKHLAVLEQVGIVSATRDGRQRLYRLEPAELKRVHDWAKQFEDLWSHQLDRIKSRAEEIAQRRLREHPTSEEGTA